MDTSNHIGVGTFEATPEMFRLVNAVLRSGRLSYGRYSKEFETRFASMHGCKYGVLSNSGTSSLLVALQTLKELHGWQDDDEVIVPALTFVASINAIIQNNLKPVLADIDDYWTIDCNLIEPAITVKTRAIMPVHLFGQPCDMSTIRGLADLHNLKIVEDSCEAAFASIKGESIDWWGDIGCHSFYMAHIITAGIGGMTLTNNPEYAKYMTSLTNHGIDLTELPNGESYDPTWLARKFRFSRVGHSFRISEFEAAIGLAQLEDWAAIKNNRQVNYGYFVSCLTDLHNNGLIKLPSIRQGVDFTPMMFPVATLTETKYGLMKHLNSRGIGVRDALPLTNQPAYRFKQNDYPNAKFMNEHGLYWGCHQQMTRQDCDFIIQGVLDYYDH